MKIVVVGLGYVGLSNAVLLAQHNEVVGVDISHDKVKALNERRSPITDIELSQYLAEKDLEISASTDLKASVKNADYVIISTPTNYDEITNFFDTSTVERVISQVTEHEPNANIVVKSTIPVGFIDDVRVRLKTNAVFFSPEFLREGKALYDNLFPSRIVVGEKSERAATFAELLAKGAIKQNIEITCTGTREAEAIKLFSNTFLAMRVAYFNELDSFALSHGMNSKEIIEGVSSDPRIGKYYNNPSFGYGGYCLPKDTKQLLANFSDIPQNLISAVVDSNSTRMDYLAKIITKDDPKVIGIYKLIMKNGSDNARQSAIFGLIERIQNSGAQIIVFEPNIDGCAPGNLRVETSLESFKSSCDIILANRYDAALASVCDKVFTRDLYGTD